MIEDKLRESFTHHEPQAPGTDALRQGIRRLAAQRRRRRFTMRAGGVAILVAAVLVAVPMVLRQTVTSSLGDVPPANTSVDVPDRALNILLVGLDPADHGSNADSITVVHITADRKQAYLIDIERDVQVDIPGVGLGKVNAAYLQGGMPVLASLVQTMTGSTLDGSVVLSLGALSQITDTLGGLRVCLPADVKIFYTTRRYPAGCSTLDGAAVTDLARERKTLPMGAYARNANIHRVLMALVTRVSSLNLFTDAGRLNALAHTDGVTIDLPGINLIELAAQLRGLTGEGLVGIVSPRFQQAPGKIPAEQLDPVVAPQLFAALRADTLDQFVTAHPDWAVTS